MPTLREPGTAPMKKFDLLWVIAGTVGFGLYGQQSRAAGVDPPPLEPPAVAPQGEERTEPGNSLPDVPDRSAAAGPRPPLGAGSYHEAAASNTPASPTVHIDRAPPAPIVERAGVNAPAADAQWIDGYWD